MSEKTWPNWNIIALCFIVSFSNTYYPCLKRRGPIETGPIADWALATMSWAIHVWKDVAQLKRQNAGREDIRYCSLSMSEKTWPNWNTFVWKKGTSPKASMLYPCLKRRGPIETSDDLSVWLDQHGLSMSEKTWPNWNEANCLGQGIQVWLSMSEKTWPNWNDHGCRHLDPQIFLSMSEKTWPNWNSRSSMVSISIAIALSMSEKTWPNWNITFLKHLFHEIPGYPCLKRRGPIETLLLGRVLHLSHPLSMSEKTWPNWN